MSISSINFQCNLPIQNLDRLKKYPERKVRKNSSETQISYSIKIQNKWVRVNKNGLTHIIGCKSVDKCNEIMLELAELLECDPVKYEEILVVGFIKHDTKLNNKVMKKLYPTITEKNKGMVLYEFSQNNPKIKVQIFSKFIRIETEKYKQMHDTFDHINNFLK